LLGGFNVAHAAPALPAFDTAMSLSANQPKSTPPRTIATMNCKTVIVSTAAGAAAPT
jgi:hypothetical protein